MIDDISLRIIWDRLVSAVNEAGQVLKRSAFSTLVRECNDFACTIMTIEGETLAIADAAVPSFSATQAITLTACLKEYPLSTWSDGDVMVTNDPWVGTAQVMDPTFLKPVVYKGRIVAFTGSVAHSPDLGGVQRWNGAADIFEEGLQIPFMKLYQAGKPNETLFQLIRANSRIPDQAIGDIMAMLASHEVAERRVKQIMSEHGLDDLSQVAEQIFRRSETAMRRAIGEVPDGHYEFSLRAEGSLGGPFQRAEDQFPADIEVVAKVTVRETNIEVDFSDSSPQVAPPINSVYPFTFAYSVYALRLLLVPHIAQNAGFIRPLRILAKEGTVLNAKRPAPTLNRGVIGHLVGDCIFGALADVIPTRARAMSGSTPLWHFFLIGADKAGTSYLRVIPMNGGMGATTRSDGIVCSFPSNMNNISIEVLELTTPIRCGKKELILDSCGAGAHRGGPGVRWVLEPLQDAIFSTTFNRVRNPPQGFLGGLNGRCGRLLINDTELRPGTEGTLKANDLVTIETPGGGGLGNPRARERVLVELDVEDGFVSRTQAHDLYGFSPSFSDAISIA